jgi:biopolymer transport protein ExbD
VNQDLVEASTLERRLRDLYKRAAELTVFITADPDVDFAQVAEVIDTANGIGIKRVGLLPRYCLWWSGLQPATGTSVPA